LNVSSHPKAGNIKEAFVYLYFLIRAFLQDLFTDREVAETLSKLAGPALHRNLRTSNDSSKQLEELSSFLLAGICSDTSMGAADIENSAFFLSLLPPSANALKSFSYTVECQSVSIVERIRSGQISRDAVDFLMAWVSSAHKSKQISKSMEGRDAATMA
jgi:hypothetical protein